MPIRPRSRLRRAAFAAAIALLPLAGCSGGDATLPGADVAGLWARRDDAGQTAVDVILTVQGDSIEGASDWIDYPGGMPRMTTYRVYGHVRGRSVSLDFWFAQSKEFTYDAEVHGERMTGTIHSIDPALPPVTNFVLDRVPGTG